MIYWYFIENSSSISIDDVRSILNIDESSLATWTVEFQYYKGENSSFLLVTDSSMPNIVLVKDGLNWIHFDKNFTFYLSKLLSASSLKVRQTQTVSGIFYKDEVWIGAFKGRMIIAMISPNCPLPIAQNFNQNVTFVDGLKSLSDEIIK